MKTKLLVIIFFTGFINLLFAQTAKVPAYKMYSNNSMKPKRGMEKQFEAAVKAHNAKFHATGPYTARLSQITEGTGSDGWYVWSMGPLMYTDLDNQPDGKKDHDDDWSKNIDPLVDTYGESVFWKLQEDLSFTPPNYNPDRLDVWTIDIKQGMRYEFAELMKKMKAMFETKKYEYAMRVFYNDLWSGKGKDAAIVFNFTNYSDFDKDIKWREDFEAMNGVGSWDNFWKKWNDCVVSTDELLRKFIK
jgi:hypothetical protein